MQAQFKAEQVHPKAEYEYQCLVREFRHHLTKTNAEHAFLSLLLAFQSDRLEQLNDRVDSTVRPVRPGCIELAAFHLYPQFGNTEERDPAAIQKLIDLVNHMETKRTLAFALRRSRHPDPNVDAILSRLSLYHQGVRGSAYPDQTKEEIQNIQARFEDWFAKRVGIGPGRALQLIDAICEQVQRNTDASVRAMNDAHFPIRFRFIMANSLGCRSHPLRQNGAA